MIDADPRQFFRNRLHFRRHSIEGRIVNCDKKIEFLLPSEFANRNQLITTREKSGFAERIQISRRISFDSGIIQKLRKRQHTAERIAVGTEMPRYQHPSRMFDQLRRRCKIFT